MVAEAEVIAKKWGSSIGVIIPRSIVEKEDIAENERLQIEVKKIGSVREVWGLFSVLKINAQRAKEEMRKGWE